MYGDDFLFCIDEFTFKEESEDVTDSDFEDEAESRAKGETYPKTGSIVLFPAPYTAREYDILFGFVPSEDILNEELIRLRSKAFHMGDIDAFRYANDLLAEENDDLACVDPYTALEEAKADFSALQPSWLRDIYSKLDKGEAVSKADLPDVLVGSTKDLTKALYRPVNQYDLEGKYIRAFSSSYEVRSALPKAYPSGVAAAAKGSTHTFIGFQWRFQDEEHPAGKDIAPLPDENRKTGNAPKTVYQVDDNGCVVAIHPSLKAAAEAVGGNAGSLSQMAKEMKPYRGYYWSYDRTERKKSGSRSKPASSPKPNNRPTEQKTSQEKAAAPVNQSKDDKRAQALRKVVHQFDLDGNFVAEHPSVADAAKAIGSYPSNMSRATKSQDPLKGYYWGFPEKKNSRGRPKKEVRQFTLAGELVNVYPSLAEAAQAIGVTPASLSNAIKRKGPSKGYLWEYAKRK